MKCSTFRPFSPCWRLSCRVPYQQREIEVRGNHGGILQSGEDPAGGPAAHSAAALPLPLGAAVRQHGDEGARRLVPRPRHTGNGLPGRQPGRIL